MHNSLDQQYQDLLREVLDSGAVKEDRTGTGTLSIFGKQIRHDMSLGFPALTTKKLAFWTMVTELKWFLRGDTNIKYLVDNNCNIWNGDAYKAYLNKESTPGIAPEGVKLHEPREHLLDLNGFVDKVKTDDEFAKENGELGPIYGAQWRRWDGVDQIKDLIKNIKENPSSRRLMVSAWNVAELEDVVLPPCHYSFQCYVVDGELSLMWNQRSADLFLGVPFNIASYGLLLLLLCEETGYKPGELIGNFGDVHLYKNHTEQALEQISREGYKLPSVRVRESDMLNGEFDVVLGDYKHHSAIKAPLSN